MAISTTIGTLVFGRYGVFDYIFPGFYGAFWGIIAGPIGMSLSYPNHLSQAKRFCLWRAYILLVIFVILASIVGFSMSVLFGTSESVWNFLSPNTDLKLLSGFEAVALMGEPSCFYNKNNLYSIQQFKPFLSYAYELSGSLAVRDVSSIHR